jgi:hypothetical protein
MHAGVCLPKARVLVVWLACGQLSLSRFGSIFIERERENIYSRSLAPSLARSLARSRPLSLSLFSLFSLFSLSHSHSLALTLSLSRSFSLARTLSLCISL